MSATKSIVLADTTAPSLQLITKVVQACAAGAADRPSRSSRAAVAAAAAAAALPAWRLRLPALRARGLMGVMQLLRSATGLRTVTGQPRLSGVLAGPASRTLPKFAPLGGSGSWSGAPIGPVNVHQAPSEIPRKTRDGPCAAEVVSTSLRAPKDKLTLENVAVVSVRRCLITIICINAEETGSGLGRVGAR